MKYKKVLITGGAGFVGSSLGLQLKSHYPQTTVYAFDNLRRRGAETNLPQLKERGISFIHGDVRQMSDLAGVPAVDLLIECSAEPSVLAGYHDDPRYVIDTNLAGAVNCLEVARRHKADLIFLSTSRVYPIDKLNGLKYRETTTRYEWDSKLKVPGVSEAGIAEDFPLEGHRSIYGATKLAAELLIGEYIQAYGIKGIINRCGVIAGPGQMGKVDQGFVTLWAARHLYKGRLSYIGYGGKGLQVRDVLHIDDLFAALDIQWRRMKEFNGQIFNIGGGIDNAVSLKELTAICVKLTGERMPILKNRTTRPADIKWYVSDCRKFSRLTKWFPRKDVKAVVGDIVTWLKTSGQPVKDLFL